MGTKIQIKSLTGSLLFDYESENNSIRKTVEAAVKEGATLRDADLWGADLRSADLWGTDLRDADLWGTDLGDADLGGADLRGADLRDAVLRDAVLRDADLRGAVLRDADLRGADLWGADLGGADGEKIKIKKAAFFNRIYKYVCAPVIAEDGTEWVVMGCFIRTLEDWEADFWNNNDEFPNNGDKKSRERFLAFETAKRWLAMQRVEKKEATNA